MWIKLKTNIANQRAFVNTKKIEVILYEPATNQWDSKIMLSGGESIIAACTPDELIAALKQEDASVVDLT